MYCKHCGNQIENESKFCSFCGEEADPIDQTIPNQLTLIQETKYTYQTNNDNGYLIAGIYFVTIQLFMILYSSFVDNWYEYRYVTVSINIVFMGLPILFAFYSKKKEHKLILLVAGLILIGWTVYVNYSKFS
jgi:hypothetical protein